MADAHSTLEPADVHARIEDGTAVLVDVRERAAYEQAHAAGAVNLPIGALVDRIWELPAGADIIVSCGGGTRGPKAAALLADHGIDSHVMASGLRGWRAAGLPVEGSEAVGA